MTCNARRILFDAQWSLERGSTIEAGVKLREALRSFLHAECEYLNCLPTQKRPPSARALARKLKKFGRFSHASYSTVCELIEVGNQAAHLVAVKPATMADAIDHAHCFLDDAPHLVELKKGGRQ